MQVNGLDFKEVYARRELVKRDVYEHGKVLLVKRKWPDRKNTEELVVFNEGNYEEDRELHGFDLRRGVKILFKKGDIRGEIKPEFMSDYDRMYTSSYKPVVDELPEKGEGLGFAAYCFLKNERYRGPVYINTKKELYEYICFQMKYQCLIRVCDSDDHIVMEVEDGMLVYPTKKMLEECNDEE